MNGKLMHASEAQIQAAIVELLELRRVVFSVTDAARVWSSNGRVGRSKVRKGWPDITCVFGGVALFLEVKSPKGVLSQAQRETHAAIRGAGGVVYVVRDAADVCQILDDIKFANGAPVRVFHMQEKPAC